MDDTDHALFPRFSGELVATALKDTPVVMVTGPRQCGKTTLVRDLVRAIANSSPWTMTRCWLRHAAIQLGSCALSIEPPLTKYSECPTSSGPSRSQWMMIAGPAGFF
jgi:energy-coupling factor transporter ATP-binding protein EcfA2